MTQKVKRVLIVGGGSSGWMTAAAIIRQCPHLEVALVESPLTPTIGVGESTIGHINEFLHAISLNDEDWMKECNATYKTSIKFINFRENPVGKKDGHTFHYPFGIFDFTDKPRGLMDWFIFKARNPILEPHNFAEFFHDSVLMTDRNKLTKNEDHAIRGFDFRTDTAYHMDATLFGNYLRDKICLPAGMTHLKADVINVIKREDGSVKSVKTQEYGEIEADLFIDCTGFKSLLLEQAMGVPFESFSNHLHNDRAIATVIPYIDKDKEMECVTSCTAIDAGWVWNIPLWNRIGTGYVYSSKFATEEEAEEQFRKHLKSKNMVIPDEARADGAQFKHIKIKHGVHKRAWEKNVVGIGLANGFIEPLESTGLMLTHEGIMKMIHTLKMRSGSVTQYDIDMFNFSFYEQITGFRNFIAQHYALSMRDDTPYWKHVTETTYQQKMVDYEPTYGDNFEDLSRRIHRFNVFGNDMNGIVYIAAGMNYNPLYERKVDWNDKRYLETPNYEREIYRTWEAHRDEVLEKIDKLPTHYEFLKNTIYK